MPLIPVSYTACSPASTIPAAISAWHFPMISSIRPGWMRPSAINRSSASRPTSRRTGSKQETTTVSGVSSMITSTPVAASKARMFRPSRPTIRPFISSEGRATAVTVLSAVSDVAPAARDSLVPALARFHQLFFGGETLPLPPLLERALALSTRGSRRGEASTALDAPSQHVESHSRGDPAAKEGCDDRQPVRHRYLSPATLRLEGGACRTANGAVRFRPSAVQLMADG